MGHQTWRLAAALLIMCLGVTTEQAVMGSDGFKKCIKSKEVIADKMRFIETQLRVAVLQCKSVKNADLPLLYNDFIRENRPFLVRTQAPLLAYLKRGGKQPQLVEPKTAAKVRALLTPQELLDNYIHYVSKRVSSKSISVPQFCERAQEAAETLVKATTYPISILDMLPVTYRRPADYCKTRQG